MQYVKPCFLWNIILKLLDCYGERRGKAESNCRKRRSWSVVQAWTSCRVQVSFHVLSVALEWAASQQQHLLQWLQALGAQEMQWAQVLDRGFWLQVYLGDMLSAVVAVNFQPQCVKTAWNKFRSCYQFSLPDTFLSRHMAMCTALVCGAQCSMPVRLGHWQSHTSNICSGMTGQWSARSAMSSRKRWSPSGPVSYLHWGPGPHPEEEKPPLVWTFGTLQRCSQNSLWHTGGVVGWCEGAVYLTSPGRPTDIGLQLGKACYPCSG